MKKSFDIDCGLPKLCDEIKRGLLISGTYVFQCGNYRLLVDAPWGWAQGQPKTSDMRRTAILSDNPCPEYKLDLLAYQPAALLTQLSLAEVAEALEKIQQGQRLVPRVSSSLTPVERATLRLTVNGHSNKDIAHVLEVGEGTIKNRLHIIFQKLGFDSRLHIALYYYGFWHVLEVAGWEPPKPIPV